MYTSLASIVVPFVSVMTLLMMMMMRSNAKFSRGRKNVVSVAVLSVVCPLFHHHLRALPGPLSLDDLEHVDPSPMEASAGMLPADCYGDHMLEIPSMTIVSMTFVRWEFGISASAFRFWTACFGFTVWGFWSTDPGLTVSSSSLPLLTIQLQSPVILATKSPFI